jgi:hyaluronan synthase
MALIKIHALFTIRRQRWLTRQVAVENGQVVHTSQPGTRPAQQSTTEAPV